MSDMELCQAAYKEMYSAMIAKDIPALSKVLDDSFVLVHLAAGAGFDAHQEKRSMADHPVRSQHLLRDFHEKQAEAHPGYRHDSGAADGIGLRAGMCAAKNKKEENQMKKLLSLLLTVILLCAALPVFAEEETAHVLVAYFSHAGENYSVGVIEEGNTAKMGKIIAEQMNADLFELVPAVPYSNVYDEVLDQAAEEQRANARPEYEGEIENWDQYDTVFIGFPIWWGKIPNIVYAFMDSYDFSGKTVIPFNTHEGSGQARSQRDMTDYLPAATVLKGLAIRGSKAQNDAEGTAKDVSNWLNILNLSQ